MSEFDKFNGARSDIEDLHQMSQEGTVEEKEMSEAWSKEAVDNYAQAAKDINPALAINSEALRSSLSQNHNEVSEDRIERVKEDLIEALKEESFTQNNPDWKVGFNLAWEAAQKMSNFPVLDYEDMERIAKQAKQEVIDRNNKASGVYSGVDDGNPWVGK